MYPDHDTLNNVSRSGYIAAQRTLESGETEGGINTARPCHWLAVFFLVNEHNNTKPQAKMQRFLQLSKKLPEGKQQLVEENDADNIRKVLCKSFIQWF